MTAWHFLDGEWVEGNPPIMGPMSHGSWMASTVFDGARAFEGVTPDLDKHFERIENSCKAMGLKSLYRPGELMELSQDGLAKFAKDAQLYIKPMYWAEAGFVAADPETTRFCLSLYDSPLPEPKGGSITLSSFRRPSIETAPTNAKAACLYPNSGRALREAQARGFDNAIMLDALGNVSELTTANVWLVKDGAAHTPVPNGTFLNGITRQRVIALLRGAGVPVYERSLTYRDFQQADELFQTGNYGKVMPITRIDDRDLQPGPVYRQARELYWSWAHGG
ncbi:branched-chain amino acid aminotransferase [Tistlia consotensis]|uniref:Probable branched-chain-amino-acid aminotransferase n=1 Tax=Tistlia consotensis USBA 355 TaxID=560819 RepID=A0A1Y6C6C1_9PROT|nr:branched-chain amino acid aminotransferase [Tistlia consotensis]SMF39270.1 branched-chain amino acid aminotransferase [Tistlia consotensis USBA 355]SNR36469.1 branched-chain amino acid aminotransferase [Tistlia consotensis]